MSPTKLAEEIDVLKRDVMEMGQLAVDMMCKAVQALKDQDLSLADWVANQKGSLDEMDRSIEERALRVLMLHQPMAVDMRTMAAILKIITYLNRIGRYGKDIAKDARALIGGPQFTKVVAIPHQQRMVCEMINDALEAFDTGDVSPLEDFAERDDDVDQLWSNIFRESITYMMEDPRKITPAIHFVMVSRHLERCGDHACKMAEKVHYMVTGEHIEIK